MARPKVKDTDLMPGITRTPTDRYRVRVRVNGEVKQRTFDRRADAEAQCVAWRTANQKGEPAKSTEYEKQTLAELAAEHMTAKYPDLSQNTYQNYLGFWKRNVQDHPIANKQVRFLAVEDIEGLRDDLRRNKVGETSIRQTLVLIQGVLGHAVKRQRISTNVAALVDKPKAKQTEDVYIPSPREVEAMRDTLSEFDAALVSVLAYSGMRPGELRALRWSDIKTKTIRITRAANPDGTIKATKTEQKRSTPLLDPLAADLKAIRNGAKDSDLVFPTRDGEVWTYEDWHRWQRRKFKKAAKAAGLPKSVRGYDLRHAIASLWLREGIDVIQVAKWLGHKPERTLNTYAHVIEDLDPEDRTPTVDQIWSARDKYATNKMTNGD